MNEINKFFLLQSKSSFFTIQAKCQAMLQAELPLDVCEKQVSDEEYLGSGKD